ncbi:sigma factor-like helix-turn-helix DNA-binding protein [Rhodoplanes sp. TEM]|uniref:Sigma factor-like helix-turn-helix DNA-binding protein n=2 Tax=Rhodoplanes tepidamans TaxID=200616 RepID=A0ABT5JF05_RHOTP|nr:MULTISPECIES: sigma factor-like helix-turn-helix DNA-binding protein [Rhodoplanes]MDC7788207.1 sigma factor-like helix-turn-helix DNA-binding protein [Rhodoplanes tepidamans]MDC7983549.1 sigma factor-like helix-turn-helix DNA-binding protein [Rhodoplanes sp. TEM]
MQLPYDQRESLILVGASGFSYADAATICEVAIGTIKSRVNLTRQRLAALLAINRLDTHGPAPTTRAVLNGTGRPDSRKV